MSFNLHRFHRARDRQALKAAEKARDRAQAALAVERNRRVAAETALSARAQELTSALRQLDECRTQREALRQRLNNAKNATFGYRYGSTLYDPPAARYRDPL